MADEWRAVLDPLRAIMGNFWRASRGTVALVVVIVTAASVASIAAPYVFSRLVDRLDAADWAGSLLAGFALYAVLMGLSVALQKMVQYLSYMSAESLSFIAATSFFDRLVRKSVGFFIEHNPAEIQTAQMRGAQSLAVIAQLLLIVFVPGIVQIALALALLGAAIDFGILAIVAVYGVAYVAFTYFANKWTRPHLEAASSAGQENARFVGNAITAMETLRYFGSAGWMSERFTGSARDIFDHWRRFSMKRIAYSGVFGVGLAVQFLVTFALLLPRYREGLLSVGDIVLFNALLLQLNQPFEMIGHAIDDVARSYARFLPFARMWKAPEEPDAPQGRSFRPEAGRLAFENVRYAYGKGAGVDRVSFTAGRGRITFIVGETGAGKSTVLKLALKSLEPEVGSITVDGTDLRRIDRRDWYGAIGVVPQDVVLLNDTLRTNIVLGRPLDEARLRAAAGKAAILERIEAMPDGFDTRVGEHGLKLSGGERQRIAIARALYGEPRFLFLDEASSALDEETERGIMDHIRAIAGEVTVIAITHRMAAIRPGDRVVTLIGGRTARAEATADRRPH